MTSLCITQNSPLPLAGQSYLEPISPDDLDLRWTLDEAEWLEPSLEEIWGDLLGAGATALTEIVRHYAVDDPYGGLRGRSAVAEHVCCELSAEQVTFGAGSSMLLRDCAVLAGHGPILTRIGTHPDLAVWAHAAGVPLTWLPENAGAADWLAAAQTVRPALIHFDRPSRRGDLPPVAAVRELCCASPQSIVVVDEAYATYLPAQESVIPLVSEVNNLVMVRSLSKGYCCGGLRVGYVVACPALAQGVRRVVEPLQVSELAFQLALRLLRTGDVCRPIRRRVREIKPRLLRWTAELSARVCGGHEELPWILIDDRDGEATAWFQRRRIAVKRCDFAPAAPESGRWIRVAVPLSDVRVSECERRLTERTFDSRSS